MFNIPGKYVNNDIHAFLHAVSAHAVSSSVSPTSMALFKATQHSYPDIGIDSLQNTLGVILVKRMFLNMREAAAVGNTTIGAALSTFTSVPHPPYPASRTDEEGRASAVRWLNGWTPEEYEYSGSRSDEEAHI